MNEEEKEPQVNPVEELTSFLNRTDELEHLDEDAKEQRKTALLSTIKAWKIIHEDHNNKTNAELEYTNARGTIGVYLVDNPDKPPLFLDEEEPKIAKYLDEIDGLIFSDEKKRRDDFDKFWGSDTDK